MPTETKKSEKGKSDYNPKNDLGAMVRFLNAVIDKTNTLIHQLDSQSNILIGISLAVFIFSANRYATVSHSYLLVLAICSGFSIITGLYAVHPPRFMRKMGQNESMMYNKKIISFKNPDEYSAELSKIIGDREAMIKQYGIELYNLSKYFYRPKRTLFKLSRNFLLLGILMSLLLFTFSSFAT